MSTDYYDIINISLNIFGTFIVYKFMKFFYEIRKSNKVIELSSYAIYTIVLSSVYLLTKTPLALLSINILSLFLLSFNYKANILKRFFSSFFIYFIIFSIELIISLLIGYINVPIIVRLEYKSLFGMITIRIVSFVIVFLLSSYQDIRRNVTFPFFYWVSIILIPVSSLYLFLLFFIAKGLSAMNLVFGIIILLLINFLIIYLYNYLSKSFSERLQQTYLEDQNHYYENQLYIMQTSLENTKTLKHDIKNYLITLHSLARNYENKDFQEYLISIISSYENKHEYSRSGNSIVDSILNYKLQEAEENNVTISLDINVPQDIKLNIDFTTILGNLIDNALSAIKTIAHNRCIDIKISYSKGTLLIKVTNTFDGLIIKKGGQIVTRKHDKKNHGIGLLNIRRTIGKYNGVMDIEYDLTTFTAVVMLYSV